VESPVLDAGCGTGNTALFFAARGREVTGIDFVEEALQRARAKALARGLTAEFLLRDAMTLATWDRRFASVIDSGLFHVYHGDDQRRYVAGLHHVLQPGGRLFLFSFTADDEHPEDGVSPRRLADIFSPGFRIESTRITQGELNPAFVAETPDAYPEGGPPMIFAVIRRTE
jgi:cyclopropane fatty-acyl-phospholipid synthase-like methyltransferase